MKRFAAWIVLGAWAAVMCFWAAWLLPTVIAPSTYSLLTYWSVWMGLGQLLGFFFLLSVAVWAMCWALGTIGWMEDESHQQETNP